MTRYTNIARKRTYVQAGFSQENAPKPEDSPQSVQTDNLELHPSGIPSDSPEAGPSSAAEERKPENSEPTKKKRRRRKPKKVDTGSKGEGGENAEGEGQKVDGQDGAKDGVTTEGDSMESKTSKTKAQKGKRKLKEKRAKDAAARKLASERRRQKRQESRHADTICFACRERGHAARYCPKALPQGEDGTNENSVDGEATPANGKFVAAARVVGICYRCGSKKHTLSRCKTPVDPSNPLPFASCFVCSGKGHLASSCPQNQSKGVYPNGGCCKLCGETTHLAKNCELRKKDSVAASNSFFGTGKDAGADEDDFHIIKRKTADLNKEEKMAEKSKKVLDVKVGVHTGVMKNFGLALSSKPKKIVTF
ncbi:hypothetical protein K474DRAFT_1634682 [Panus rudis PR-1116 ss-1]|nr:hypothetical protein K474DRAFT_1634682 [Panus rudis PR-1116 ss-1]